MRFPRSWPRRICLALVFGVGCSFFFITYPPMIDVPQHAAQVSLLDSMLRGESAFAEEYELNFLTPYLLGYGTWLIASQILGLHLALSFILALAFIGTYAAFIQLRRRFGAPSTLDPLAVAGFFGFAFEWGMLTFLLSVPVGLLFLAFFLDFLRDESFKRGLVAALVGALLIASHGLVFAYFFVLSGCFALEKLRRTRSFPQKELLLFVPLALVAILYSLRADELSPLWADPRGSYVQGAGFARRAYQLLHYQLSAFAPKAWHLAAVIALLLSPLLLALRPSKEPARYLPLGFFLVYFFTVPHDAMDTSLLWQRFSLLFLPSFALIFDARDTLRSSRAAHIASLALVIGVAFILLPALGRMRAFDRETEDFRAVLEALPAEKRALALIYDRKSPAAENPAAYVHFASWYAAEKGGLVDFNFAWFPPQIVRYKKEAAPEVRPSFEWRPNRFRELKHCDRYDYLIVRGELTHPARLLRGTSCPHQFALSEGTWTVFERSAR